VTDPKKIVVEPGSELDRLLDEVDPEGLLIERNGDLYRLERADSAPSAARSGYDPDAARAAIEAAAGSWSDVDIDALVEQIYRTREEGSRPLDPVQGV
jgi:hypothetical protein